MNIAPYVLPAAWFFVIVFWLAYLITICGIWALAGGLNSAPARWLVRTGIALVALPLLVELALLSMHTLAGGRTYKVEDGRFFVISKANVNEVSRRTYKLIELLEQASGAFALFVAMLIGAACLGAGAIAQKISVRQSLRRQSPQ